MKFFSSIAEILGGEPLQRSGENNSIQDAQAVMKLYKLVRVEWEKYLMENPMIQMIGCGLDQDLQRKARKSLQAI